MKILYVLSDQDRITIPDRDGLTLSSYRLDRKRSYEAHAIVYQGKEGFKVIKNRGGSRDYASYEEFCKDFFSPTYEGEDLIALMEKGLISRATVYKAVMGRELPDSWKTFSDDAIKKQQQTNGSYPILRPTDEERDFVKQRLRQQQPESFFDTTYEDKKRLDIFDAVEKAAELPNKPYFVIDSIANERPIFKIKPTGTSPFYSRMIQDGGSNNDTAEKIPEEPPKKKTRKILI